MKRTTKTTKKTSLISKIRKAIDILGNIGCAF